MTGDDVLLDELLRMRLLAVQLGRQFDKVGRAEDAARALESARVAHEAVVQLDARRAKVAAA